MYQLFTKIINKILNCVQDVKQLKALRLLNKTWNELGTARLSQKSSVELNSPQRLKLYLKKLEMLEAITISPHRSLHISSCDIIEETERHLFSVIKLTRPKELHLTNCYFLNLRHLLNNLADLSSICNGSLYCVSINDIRFLSKNNIDYEECEERNFKFEEMKPIVSKFISWSSIRKLELTDSFSDVDESFDTLNFPWSTVLPCLINLNILHVQLANSEDLSEVITALLDLKVVPRITEWSSFLSNMTAEQMQSLQVLNLPLKSLDLSLMMESAVCAQTLASLLLSYGQTLENLKVLIDHDTDEFDYALPIENQNILMSRLIHMEWMTNAVPVNLLAICPNLKSLNVSEVNQNLFVKEIVKPRLKNPCGNKILENLTSFSLECEVLREENLLLIGKAFPNMKKLCLFLDDSKIRSIYKGFPNLEELFVLGNEVTDIGFAGWPLKCSCSEEGEQENEKFTIACLASKSTVNLVF